MTAENDLELWMVLNRWERVREDWYLTREEETRLLAGSTIAGPVNEVPSWGARQLEQRMRLLTRLAGALTAVLREDERIRAWLRRPLESLGERTPLEAMASSIEWIRVLEKNAADFVLERRS